MIFDKGLQPLVLVLGYIQIIKIKNYKNKGL